MHGEHLACGCNLGGGDENQRSQRGAFFFPLQKVPHYIYHYVSLFFIISYMYMAGACRVEHIRNIKELRYIIINKNMAGAPTLSCPRGNIGRNCIYGQQGNEILPLGDLLFLSSYDVMLTHMYPPAHMLTHMYPPPHILPLGDLLL